MDGFLWRKFLLAFIFALASKAAFAQYLEENPPSPSDQLVYADLGTADLIQQPGTLEQQIAALQHRLDALEHPPIKFPSNVQLLGVFQADGVTLQSRRGQRGDLSARFRTAPTFAAPASPPRPPSPTT